jgi:biopolymer transport protein TolQ
VNIFINSTDLLLADGNLNYVWAKAPLEGKAIIITLLIFSIFAWTVMVSKALQMARAKKLNGLFEAEFRTQKNVLGIYDRKIEVDGCPMFAVYREGSQELDTRVKTPEGGRKQFITLKSMEHIKRTLESAVAREAIRLESGLILLAIAVSGAPFLGLLGTVWGVMITFADVGQRGQADLPTMAPGVSAALVTTVAGLLVAIPSMFAYNWLVHTLRVITVELDNFAQQLVSRMETEYLKDE